MAMLNNQRLPSGKQPHKTNWKITMLLMGQLTISMAIFKFANCKRLPEGTLVGSPMTPLDGMR